MSKETPPPYSAHPAPAPGFVPPPGPPPGPQVHQHRGLSINYHMKIILMGRNFPVIVTTGTVAGPVMVGPDPMTTMCPYCHAQITTTMETEANTKTHLFALLLCVFGLVYTSVVFLSTLYRVFIIFDRCWPCCCIPYCTDTCQSRKHYCPNCRAFLGAYSD